MRSSNKTCTRFTCVKVSDIITFKFVVITLLLLPFGNNLIRGSVLLFSCDSRWTDLYVFLFHPCSVLLQTKLLLHFAKAIQLNDGSCDLSAMLRIYSHSGSSSIQMLDAIRCNFLNGLRNGQHFLISL